MNILTPPLIALLLLPAAGLAKAAVDDAELPLES